MLSGLPFHDSVLNVLLTSVGPEAPAFHARKFQAAIPLLREHFKIPSSVEWLAGYAAAADTSWCSFDRFYNPLTYACLGAFDLVTVYLSPNTGQPRPRANEWPGSGLYLNLCLLPNFGTDCPNAAFMKGYTEPAPADQPLPVARRFLLVSKLKLNSPAIWPLNATQPQRESCELLFRVADSIRSWRSDKAPADSTAGIGLGLGWSEVVVIANSSSIAALLHLLWGLRCLHAPVGWKPKQVGHCFSTSLSNIAYDFHVIECAQAVSPPKPKRLLAVAQELAGKFPRGAAEKLRDSLTFQTTFSVYPGHEALLAKVCAQAQDALLRSTEGAAPAGQGAGGIVGRMDLGGPVIRTREQMTELEALAYLALLRRIALRTDHRGRYRSDGLLNFYGSNTNVGLASVESNAEIELVPSNHYKQSASTYSMPGARALDKSLTIAVDELADSLRALQVPYSRTEQILHLVAKYQWTTKLDVLWEDAAPLAPLVFSLRNYLRGLWRWWEAISLRELPEEVEDVLSNQERGTRTAVRIRQRLEFLLERELPALLEAFRTNFHYKQMGGYLTDQLPDINLRYLGSVHQILNITNMVLDVFTLAVLGQRACIATTGDPSVPDIKTAADVVLLRVHADSINTPILLESLGHEVGHLWFVQMLSDRKTQTEREVANDAFESSWAVGCSKEESYRKVQQAFFAVVDAAFFGEIDKNNYFIETLADYVEWRLLGCDLEEWSSSFLFRNLVLAPLVHQDARKEDRVPPDPRPLVPGPAPLYLEAGLVRAIGVCVLESLASWAPSANRYENHLRSLRKGKLQRFQRHLASKACLGPARDLNRAVLDKDEWDRMIGVCEEWLGPLFEPVVANEVKALCKAIDAHLAVQRKKLSLLERTLLNEITAAFANLRREFLPLLTNSLHIKWFASRTDLESVKRQKDPQRNRWRVQPQPARAAKDLEDRRTLPRPDTLIYQRGAIFPTRPEVAQTMLRATSEFLGRCLLILPGWRKQLLGRIAELES